MLKELLFPKERYVLEKPSESHGDYVSILTEHFAYAMSGAVIQDYLCTNEFSSKEEILAYEPAHDSGGYTLGTYKRKKLIFLSASQAQSFLNSEIKNVDDFRIVRIKDLNIDDYTDNRKTV